MKIPISPFLYAHPLNYGKGVKVTIMHFPHVIHETFSMWRKGGGGGGGVAIQNPAPSFCISLLPNCGAGGEGS